MWIFVDVDGTLIDQDDNPRPYIPEFILGLKELGCTIVIWSAGGSEYADRKFNMICNKLYYSGNTNWDLRKLIRSYLSKRNHQDAALILKDRQFYVDDVKELLDAVRQKGHGVFKVPFYNDPSGITEKDDRWLLGALEGVSRYLARFPTLEVVEDEKLVRPKETPDPNIAEENEEREKLKDLSERFS